VTDDPGTTLLEFDLIRPIYLGSGWILVAHPGRKAYRASDDQGQECTESSLGPLVLYGAGNVLSFRWLLGLKSDLFSDGLHR
jgi:hypothetical protein